MSTGHFSKAFVFCLLFSLVSSGLFVDFAVAEPLSRVAGVKAGNVAKYGNFLALWGSELPDAVPPQDFVDVNNTVSLVNTILDVSGTTVTFSSATVYRNGTERSEVKSVDMVYGSGLGNLTILAAGLSAGDGVYISEGFSQSRINSTSLRGYCGLMRETNLLNVTQVLSTTGKAYWTELYWDKATGLLVEHFLSYAELSEAGYLTEGNVSYSMVDNNVWVDVPDSVMPVAEAGPDRTVDAGATVVFDASGSSDNMGIAGFLWDFGDGESAEGLTVSHIYGRGGAFNVTLTVEDGAGNKGLDHVIVTVPEPINYGLVFLAVVLTVSASVLLIRQARKRRPRGQGRRRR